MGVVVFLVGVLFEMGVNYVCFYEVCEVAFAGASGAGVGVWLVVSVFVGVFVGGFMILFLMLFELVKC